MLDWTVQWDLVKLSIIPIAFLSRNLGVSKSAFLSEWYHLCVQHGCSVRFLPCVTRHSPRLSAQVLIIVILCTEVLQSWTELFGTPLHPSSPYNVGYNKFNPGCIMLYWETGVYCTGDGVFCGLGSLKSCNRARIIHCHNGWKSSTSFVQDFLKVVKEFRAKEWNNRFILSNVKIIIFLW